MIGIKVCMVNRTEKYAIAIARLPVSYSFIECFKFICSFRSIGVLCCSFSFGCSPLMSLMHNQYGIGQRVLHPKGLGQ